MAFGIAAPWSGVSGRLAAGDSHERWMAGRAELIRRACARLRLPADGRVLDVAAGDGTLSNMVRDLAGGQLICHDHDGRECARAALAARPAVRGDVRNLPFKTGAADLTIAFEIVEHMEPWEAHLFVAELARVTRPGGTLLLSTPNRYSLQSFRGLARYLRDGTVWNANDQTHTQIYSLRSLVRLVETEFAVERTLGYYLLPEARGHESRWTHRISESGPLVGLSHKLMIVARRRGG